MIRLPASLPLLPVLLVAACAAPGSYPSLARRPAERVAGAPLPPCAAAATGDSARVTGCAEPAGPAPAPPLPEPMADRGRDSQLAGLVARARRAHAGFIGKRAQAERTIIAGSRAGVGSEPWSVAQIAMAGLDSTRGEAMIAMAELDSLYAADRVANPAQPGPDSAAIAAAREEVMVLVAQEDALLHGLAARLPD